MQDILSMYFRLPPRTGSTCQAHDRVPLTIHSSVRIGQGKGSIVEGRCINRYSHPKHFLCQCGGTRPNPATNATIVQMGILSLRKYGILEPAIPCIATAIFSDQQWKAERMCQIVLSVSFLLSSGLHISNSRSSFILIKRIAGVKRL